MCEEKQGIYQLQPAPKAVLYTPETHHALIALHSAKHSHPINSILDDDYHIEVEMLCPGTVLPHPTTVQCDLIDTYIHSHVNLCHKLFYGDFFFLLHLQKLNNISRHLILLSMLHWMDGQAPLLCTFYLGLVIWYANGTINHAVLEFIWNLFY